MSGCVRVFVGGDRPMPFVREKSTENPLNVCLGHQHYQRVS